MMVFVHIWDGEIGISTFLFVSVLLFSFYFCVIQYLLQFAVTL